LSAFGHWQVAQAVTVSGFNYKQIKMEFSTEAIEGTWTSASANTLEQVAPILVHLLLSYDNMFTATSDQVFGSPKFQLKLQDIAEPDTL
jgi:hypothetical protein